VETTTQDLAARIERLEQTMSRAHLNADPFAKISFAGWLKVSGPSFAVMLCGFTLLWNSQESMRSQMLELNGATNTRMLELNEGINARMLELNEGIHVRMLELNEGIHARMLEFQTATNAQLLELTRTTGRLEGAIDRLDSSVAELRVEVRRLGERVDALEH
jgi:outer membrane murein-binding lipoprotein Lpp